MTETLIPKDPNAPNKYQCMKCGANFSWAPARPASPWDLRALFSMKNTHPRCPQCKSRFVALQPDLRQY